jgi:preprotein translocase subunit SecD
MHRALVAIGLATIATPCWSQGSESGFAVREVIAEAGLHPDLPLVGARKVESDEGHAYWVKPHPIVSGGIVEVGMVKGEAGWKVWLRVNDADAKQMREFTSANVGSQIALMLDGRIIGEPPRIMTPISGTHWETAETNSLVAYARCLNFDKASDGGVNNPNAAASRCRFPVPAQ